MQIIIGNFLQFIRTITYETMFIHMRSKVSSTVIQVNKDVFTSHAVYFLAIVTHPGNNSIDLWWRREREKYLQFTEHKEVRGAVLMSLLHELFRKIDRATRACLLYSTTSNLCVSCLQSPFSTYTQINVSSETVNNQLLIKWQQMAGSTFTLDSCKMKGLRSHTFDESIYRWCTRSPAELATVASTSILSSPPPPPPSSSSLTRSNHSRSSIPCLIKKPTVYSTVSSSSSSSSSSSCNYDSHDSSASDSSDECDSKNTCSQEPLIPASSFTVVNASVTSSQVSDSFKSSPKNCLISRSFHFNHSTLPACNEVTDPISSHQQSPSCSKIKRSTSLAFHNNICSSNCSKLTVSLSSNSFSNVSSRFSRRNLDYLDFSLDSLSISSSSSCSSTDETKGNHQHNPHDKSKLPAMCKIKKEAAKLSESILLRAICELTSDSDVSSYSTGTGCGNVSSSSLNRVKPPSIMDRVSSTANTSSSIMINSKGTYFKRRVSKSCSPRKRSTLNGGANQNSPLHRKTNRNKLNLMVKNAQALKCSRQDEIMSTSLDETSESFLLGLTGPPSLMDQVSGCWSEHKPAASIASGAFGNNLMSAGSSSANSLNSLNSVSSDIFDLPTSDPAVNQAANDLVQGIQALTKNHQNDPSSDHKQFNHPVREEYHEIPEQNQLFTEGCVNIVNPNQIDLIVESDEEADVLSGATYDIKVERPKLEDVIEEDSLALAPFTEKEIKLDALDDQCNTTATFVVDSLHIAKFGPLTNQNEPSQLGELMSISDLPTLKMQPNDKEAVEEQASSDKSDSDDCRSDFGVDNIPTDNTVTLVANDSNTQVVTGDKGNHNKLTADDVLNDSLYIGTTDTSEEIDAIFCNDEDVDLKNLSASEYEKYLKEEKAKLLAHTFAEMDICAKTCLASSSIDRTDAPLDLSSLSLGLLSREDCDDIDEDDFDEDTRATYFISDLKGKNNSKVSVRTPSSNYPDDTTYPIESPSSKGSSESNYFTCLSDTQTYSIDDSSEYKTAVSSTTNQTPSSIATPRTLVMNNGVRIRETRASALRAEKARSLGEKSKLFSPSIQTMPRSKTLYTLSNQSSSSSKIPAASRATSNLKLSSGYRAAESKIPSSRSANPIMSDGEKKSVSPAPHDSSKSAIPTSRSMSNVNSRFASIMRKRIE